MQTVTTQYIKAVTAGSVTWASTQLRADWDNSGTASSGIDVMDPQLGDQWSVRQSLDEGFPSEVRDTDGTGVPELKAALVQGAGSLPVAGQYFSPFRSDSPVYGYDRDVAAIFLNSGVVPASGAAEYVRLFTGQMADIPVQGRRASLEAVSANRLKLAALVSFPLIDGTSTGLNATWPIVFSLYSSGLNAVRPPRGTCAVWWPMCGSMHPMLPSVQTGSTFSSVRVKSSVSAQRRPYFDDAPPDMGLVMSETSTYYDYAANFDARVDTDQHLLSTQGSTGRIEFWVRATASTHAVSYYSSVQKVRIGVLGSGIAVAAGIDANRKPFMELNDGSAVYLKTHSTAMATDGAWHFVGCAYSFTEKKLWTNLDGTVESTTNAGIVTTNRPATDEANTAYFETVLGLRDVQISAQASPTTDSTWLSGISWTSDADIYRSYTELQTLNINPQQAFSYISTMAQGELAAIGFNEHDLFQYWTPARWAQDDQQTSVDTFSTSTNIKDGGISVTRDPSRVRNIIRVSYTSTQVDVNRSSVAEIRELTPVPPGVTLIKIPLLTPALGFETTLLAFDPTGPVPLYGYYCLNLQADGSGMWYDGSSGPSLAPTVIAVSPSDITIEFANATPYTWYLVVPSANADVANLSIGGYAVRQSNNTYVTVQDDASIFQRGQRALTVTLSQIQTSDDATRVGMWLLDELAFPLNRVQQLEVFGDPRRQPGDLITVEDSLGTGASGDWRAMVVEHERNGALFSQRINVKQVVGVTGLVVADAESEGLVNPTAFIVGQSIIAADW